MTFEPGKLKERVVIQRLSESRIGGEITNVWATLATVWAKVLPRGSREAYRQSQVVAELEYLVIIRRYDGIMAKDRLTWGSKTLEIIGAIETDEDGTETTELYCTEVDNA